MPTMPTKNFRLIAVVALFTALAGLADYEVKNDLDFFVGATVGILTLAILVTVLTLLERD